MGDLDSVISLEAVGAILGVWLSVLILVWRLSPKIHLLQLGTDKALTLGIDVSYVQWMMVLLSALSAAAAVSDRRIHWVCWIVGATSFKSMGC